MELFAAGFWVLLEKASYPRGGARNGRVSMLPNMPQPECSSNETGDERQTGSEPPRTTKNRFRQRELSSAYRLRAYPLKTMSARGALLSSGRIEFRSMKQKFCY